VNSEQIKKYNFSMRIMHWIVGIFVIVQLAGGFFMKDIELSLQPSIYSLHKSIGVLIGLLCIVRIANRLNSSIPSPHQSISSFERFTSRIGVFLLYAGMFVMPISGYLMSIYYGYQVLFFGIGLPLIVETNNEIASIFSKIHSTTAIIFLGIISLHFLSTIKHILVDKVNILKRIT